MGRPPHGGGPVFRFTHAEVAEMEACLQGSNNVTPSRETIEALANKFSASADRAGKIVVQTKQVWNWFQNRRYAQRAKTQRSPAKLGVTSANREDLSTYRNAANSVPILTPAPSPAPVPAPAIASAHTAPYVSDISQMEFEAKSVRDGAWYDVATFLSHRMFESGDPEVLVRFTGFGVEEDEWVNVRKCVRLRSLPCEPSECVVVLPGDLILCFQEGKDQALYFDAHVLDAQRRRHDVRGCRCRFLVRYAHDQSEEIVPLRKICRRPETDYRLQILHASKALGPVDTRTATKDPGSSKGLNLSVQIPREPHKLVDTSTDQLVTAVASTQEPSAAESAAPMATESVGIATPVVTQASQVVAGDVGETVQ